MLHKVSLLVLILGFTAACDQGLQSNYGNSGQANNLQTKLAWNSNRGEQQGFYIEESSDGTNFKQVLTVPDGINSATITLPTAGQNYYFRIRGFNQAGTSPYSSVITAAVR